MTSPNALLMATALIALSVSPALAQGAPQSLINQHQADWSQADQGTVPLAKAAQPEHPEAGRDVCDRACQDESG